jgi:hypothetical protein
VIVLPPIEGTVNADTMRSGPTCTARAAVLLASLVSGTALPASAAAIT